MSEYLSPTAAQAHLRQTADALAGTFRRKPVAHTPVVVVELRHLFPGSLVPDRLTYPQVVGPTTCRIQQFGTPDAATASCLMTALARACQILTAEYGAGGDVAVGLVRFPYVVHAALKVTPEPTVCLSLMLPIRVTLSRVDRTTGQPCQEIIDAAFLTADLANKICQFMEDHDDDYTAQVLLASGPM